MTFYHFFSGYLDPLFSEGRTFLWNICESSGFILLFPFVIALLLVERIYARRHVSSLFWALVIYVLVLGAYMMVGFAEPLSKATLLSFVPGNRAVFAMGLASVLLTGLFIATPRVTEVPRWMKIATIPVSFGLFVAFAYGFRAAYDFPLSGGALAVCVALSVAVGALAFRARPVFYAVMLALVILPSVWTNPVASGLDPIYGKRLVVAVQRAAAREPHKRWLAYGDRYIPQITKAAGADVYNGVSWPPERQTLARLDPEGRPSRYGTALPTWRPTRRDRAARRSSCRRSTHTPSKWLLRIRLWPTAASASSCVPRVRQASSHPAASAGSRRTTQRLSHLRIARTLVCTAPKM